MALTGGIVAGVGSVASGLIGGSAAKSAASAEEGYLNSALNFQEGVYNTAQTNLSPWISGGQSALSQLEAGMGIGGTSGSSNLQNYWNQYTSTPYYTFPLQQATTSMNQAAASKGLSLSGGQLAGLGQYGAGYASQYWGNYMSALNSLSNTGQTASSQLGQIGSNVGSQVGQTSSNLASAAQGGIMGSAAGTSQAISGLSQILGGQSISGTGSSYGGGSGSNTGSSNTGSGGLIGALASLFGSGNSGGAGTISSNVPLFVNS